jgi:hypothetical protein
MVLKKVLDRKYILIIKIVFVHSFYPNRIISEPRLQNPYLLYSNTNSHSSPYDFSANEYQQRKIATSFSHTCKFIIV